VGSGRGVHGKENPRANYAVGLRTEPALLVRGSSRRITIMRFRPANIRVINRRNSLWCAKIPSGSHLTEMLALICSASLR